MFFQPILKSIWFVALICLSYFIQSHMLLRDDVAYLTYVSGQLFDGKQYGVDIFETNPPMILYLSLPIYWLTKFHILDVTHAARLYLFFLSIFSWLTVCWMLRVIFDKKNRVKQFILETTLLIIFFYLPVNQIGQREDFFMIFIMPYIFSVICFLENKSIENSFVRALIGIVAGVGFALKPYFLATFMLIELAVVWRKNSVFACLRVETMMIILVCFFYGISIFLFQPNYIHILLPLISDFYFPSIKSCWACVFLHTTTLYCAIIFLLAMLLIKRHQTNQNITLILMAALLGTMLAYIIPRAPWFYHMIPAKGFATLLAVYMITESPKKIFSSMQSISVINFIYICVMLFMINFMLTETARYMRYFWNDQSEKSYKNLVNYIKNIPISSRRIMCFSGNTTGECFPLVYLTEANYVGSGPFFWWLRGVLGEEMYPLSFPLSKQHQIEKNFLMNKLVQDLEIKKPCVIIINSVVTKQAIFPFFDFVTYFSSYPTFQKAFKPYHKKITLGDYTIYRRDDNSCRG